MRRLLSGILLLVLTAHLPAADDFERLTVQFNPGRISWNPHYAYSTTEAQIFTALYEGLAVFHPATLKPVPGAAESWDLSDDGRTITFHIRENARWSNGDDLTAEDFRNSWLTILSPETGAEFASLLDDITGAREYRTGRGTRQDVGVEAVDGKTLVVRLNAASPQFISITCHYSFAPVHRDFLRMVDWSAIRSVPVNGPFMIRARNREEILMDANPWYHDRESVGVEGIRMLFLNDPSEVMARFNRFDIDWVVSGMDTSLLTIAEALNISPLFSTTYYYFSNTNGPWADGRIRRAMSLLVPWEALRINRFIPATSLVPPIPNYPEAGAGFPASEEERRSEAMTLLEEAGYPGGTGLPDPVIRVSVEDDVSRAMVQAWREHLNLNTRIETVENFQDYYSSLKLGGWDLATLTWTGDYADPHTFLGMWQSRSSFNDSGYSDSVFDNLLAESANLPYLERFARLMEAERILLESSQVLPVEHFPSVNLIDRRFVDGWFPNALDIHPFKDLRLKQGFDIPGVAMADLQRQGM